MDFLIGTAGVSSSLEASVAPWDAWLRAVWTLWISAGKSACGTEFLLTNLRSLSRPSSAGQLRALVGRRIAPLLLEQVPAQMQLGPTSPRSASILQAETDRALACG